MARKVVKHDQGAPISPIATASIVMSTAAVTSLFTTNAFAYRGSFTAPADRSVMSTFATPALSAVRLAAASGARGRRTARARMVCLAVLAIGESSSGFRSTTGRILVSSRILHPLIITGMQTKCRVRIGWESGASEEYPARRLYGTTLPPSSGRTLATPICIPNTVVLDTSHIPRDFGTIARSTAAVSDEFCSSEEPVGASECLRRSRSSLIPSSAR